MKLGKPLTEQEQARVLGAKPVEPRAPVLGAPVPESSVRPPDFRQEPPSFLASVGRGVKDIEQGGHQGMLAIKDLFTGRNEREAYTDRISEEIALYERGRGEDAGFDFGRLTGQIGGGAPLIPLTSAAPTSGLLARSGAGALEGALGAGLTFTDKGESTPLKMAFGGMAGGMLPIAMQAGAKVGGNLLNRARIAANRIVGASDDVAAPVLSVRPGGVVSLEGLKNSAQQQMDLTGQLTDDVLRRKANMNTLGFTGNAAPTIGQVTRNPNQFALEQNLKGIDNVGEPLVQRFKNQGNRFNELMSGVKKSTGQKIAGTGQGEYIGQDAVDAIARRYQVTQKMVGRLYAKARNQYGDIGGISPDNVIRKIKDELLDDESLSPVTNSVLNRLRRRGLLDENNVPTDKTLTVSQAEGLRKWIGTLSNQGGNREAKRQVIDALDDDVFSTIGDDAFGQARQMAKERFGEFENKLVSRVIKGTLQPSQVINTLRNASTNHIDELRTTLNQSGALGKQSWNDMRGQLFDDIWRKGGGEEGMTKQFVNQLDQIGKKKLKAIYPENFDRIMQLRQAVLDMNVAPRDAAINRSATALTQANLLQRLNVPLIRNIQSALQTGSKQADVRAALMPLEQNAAIEASRAMEGKLMQSLYAPNLLGHRVPGVGQFAPLAAGVSSFPLLEESQSR